MAVDLSKGWQQYEHSPFGIDLKYPQAWHTWSNAETATFSSVPKSKWVHDVGLPPPNAMWMIIRPMDDCSREKFEPSYRRESTGFFNVGQPVFMLLKESCVDKKLRVSQGLFEKDPEAKEHREILDIIARTILYVAPPVTNPAAMDEPMPAETLEYFDNQPDLCSFAPTMDPNAMPVQLGVVKVKVSDPPVSKTPSELGVPELKGDPPTLRRYLKEPVDLKNAPLGKSIAHFPRNQTVLLVARKDKWAFIRGYHAFPCIEGWILENQLTPAKVPLPPIRVRAPKDAMKVRLNLQDRELQKAAWYVGKATGRSFQIDGRVMNSKITVVAPSDLPAEEAYELFVSDLRKKQFVVKEDEQNASAIILSCDHCIQ
jgi:hypothetical protein